MYFFAKKGTYTMRFNNNVKCVIIFDHDDNIFYIRDTPSNFDGILKINFPFDGIYYCDDCFAIEKIQPLIVDVSQIELPPFERNYFKDIEIVKNYEDNMPACIYPNITDEYAVIVLGKKYFDSPLTFRLFYLLHEFGHLFYDTEKYCDLFAFKYGKLLGCNESNMLYAMTKILNLNSIENQDRILFIHSILNKQ